jgi:hypothetical protein
VLSLLDMQQSTVGALRRIAATARNRQYSIACEQMAHAMEAHARGDLAARTEHIAFAIRAHKRAGEDEGGQLLRVRHTQNAIAELELDDGGAS